jgi:NAD(P)-dependent dehydrogenase (short-subunit alcohol dehydrogenase family)
MHEFSGKVAVVTGAASGIGRALAERSAREGMKVVLADVDEPALARTTAELQAAGATVLAVPTDVSRLADVENLARRTLETFGGVHLLFNNAGVGAGMGAWQCTEADWQWVLGVNLWGVIHGLRVFVPIMLAQGTEGHIVNTASLAGVLPYHPCATYQTTKFAVVGLSENLYHSLASMGAPVKASVLCPGWINTQIITSERNRPAGLQNPPAPPLPPESQAVVDAIFEGMNQAVRAGLPPEAVADCVFAAIREERFYIYANAEEFLPLVEQRNDEVLHARNPAVMPLG